MSDHIHNNNILIKPSDRTIYRVANKIISSLRQDKYKWDINCIISLFNIISTKVQDNKIRFGDCIGAVQQLKTKLSKLGTRGTTTQQQTKQAIIASLIIQDNNKNIINTKFIKSLLPHKNYQCKNDFIIKCNDKLNIFDLNNDAEQFVNDKKRIIKFNYVLLQHSVTSV